MHRDRITLVALSLTLALGVAVGCTDSEPVNNNRVMGTAGNTNPGSAGNTSGSAGSAAGSAGATGSAGDTSGSAGSAAGAAGGTAGAGGTGGAGTAGAGGTGGAGTAGATGTGGAGGKGGAGGAGGSGTAGAGGATVSFATDIYPIIMAKCKDCHTKATGQSGMLNMSTNAMTAYTSLVGADMMGANATTDLTCTLLSAAKKRVVPGDPDHSYLYIKISQTAAALTTAKCGPSMPQNNANGGLTADEKTKIQSWIMGGAKM